VPTTAAEPSTAAAAPTTTTTAPTTTTTAPPVFPPLPPPGDARAVVTTTGIVLPVRRTNGDGTHLVATPCGREAVVAGAQPITGAHVVLDPGHGGEETGTAGDADGDGTREYPEKVLNFDVAQKVKERLEAQGATVVMTRLGDYRIALRTRAEIGVRLQPLAFVSIHFNGGHDVETPHPGTETYFQIGSPDSRRLAGLLYEEIFATLSRYEGVGWVADSDFGAKYRPASDGGDYYGILRRTAGIPAALAELGFLNNPPEAALYLRDDVQDAMADATSSRTPAPSRPGPAAGWEGASTLRSASALDGGAAAGGLVAEHDRPDEQADRRQQRQPEADRLLLAADQERDGEDHAEDREDQVDLGPGEAEHLARHVDVAEVRQRHVDRHDRPEDPDPREGREEHGVAPGVVAEPCDVEPVEEGRNQRHRSGDHDDEVRRAYVLAANFCH
jgi:N-acetylmuramoyl-L-alanine amidase